MYTTTQNFNMLLVDALGLRGQAITKIVIESEVNGIPTVIVKGLIDKDKCGLIADAFRMIQVADVTVDDNGDVQVEYHKNGEINRANGQVH